MVRLRLHRQDFSHRLLRGALLFALVFGALHVALHGLNDSGLSAQDDCQICRLAHSPAMDLPLLLPLLAVFWLGFELPLLRIFPAALVAHRLGWARAPPLS